MSRGYSFRCISILSIMSFIICDRKFSVTISAEISVSVCVSVSVQFKLSVSAKISVQNATKNRNMKTLFSNNRRSILHFIKISERNRKKTFTPTNSLIIFKLKSNQIQNRTLNYALVPHTQILKSCSYNNRGGIFSQIWKSFTARLQLVSISERAFCWYFQLGTSFRMVVHRKRRALNDFRLQISRFYKILYHRCHRTFVKISPCYQNIGFSSTDAKTQF